MNSGARIILYSSSLSLRLLPVSSAVLEEVSRSAGELISRHARQEASPRVCQPPACSSHGDVPRAFLSSRETRGTFPLHFTPCTLRETTTTRRRAARTLPSSLFTNFGRERRQERANAHGPRRRQRRAVAGGGRRY